MGKQTAWAHLPNAHHIDRILEDIKHRPAVWASAAYDASRSASRSVSWYEAWYEAWEITRGSALHAARDEACTRSWSPAQCAARDAILSLIAWDAAAAILDMPPDAVRLLAASGHHPAVLLLPAAVALATTT